MYGKNRTSWRRVPQCDALLIRSGVWFAEKAFGTPGPAVPSEQLPQPHPLGSATQGQTAALCLYRQIIFNIDHIQNVRLPCTFKVFFPGILYNHEGHKQHGSIVSRWLAFTSARSSCVCVCFLQALWFPRCASLSSFSKNVLSKVPSSTSTKLC